MKIILEFDNLEESRPVLNAIYGMNYAPVATPVGAGAAPVAEQPPTSTRRRRTKAEIAADEAAAAAAEAASTPAEDAAPVGGDWDEDGESEPVTITYTKDDVRAALVAYQGRTNMDKAQALLKKVGGVEKLGTLPEAKYAEVINAAKNAK